VSEAKVKVKSKQFIYEARLKWTGGRDGLLTSEDKLPIGISTPPEFKGSPKTRDKSTFSKSELKRVNRLIYAPLPFGKHTRGQQIN